MKLQANTLSSLILKLARQYNLKCPVISSIRLEGPGPTASTVVVPGANCVCPASRIDSVCIL